MAAPTTLPALLASLTQSLSLTQEATPKIAEIEHPKDGISLLDVKNELLLSYLQNLVFLILLKLRNAKSDAGSTELDESVRAKKTTKFGSLKYVYPAETMRELRAWFEREIPDRMPAARVLYWT